MSKEKGILTKENAERILGSENIKAKLSVKGADGKAKISSLASGAYRVATPEQMKAAQNGGVAVDWMLLKNMDDLALNGSTHEVKNTERAHEITMKADENAKKVVAARKQALSMAKGSAER